MVVEYGQIRVNLGKYWFNLGRFDIVLSWTDFNSIMVDDGSTRFNLGRQG